MEAAKYTSEDAGCYIDGSAGNADQLNERIISFAKEHGCKEEFDYTTVNASDIDKSEELNWIADDCIEWMNENTVGDSCYWTIEDNSLFLVDLSAEEL